MTNGVMGVTDAQKKKLRAQIDLRAKARADTRGSTKRRTGRLNTVTAGQGSGYINPKLGVKLRPDTLAGTNTPLTAAMKRYAKSYIGPKATRTTPGSPFREQYKKDFKAAHKAAETDPRKTKVTGVSWESHKTGQKRKDIRAWGENQIRAAKKRYNIGSGSTQTQRDAYAQKQVDVDKRRRKAIGAPKRTYPGGRS